MNTQFAAIHADDLIFIELLSSVIQGVVSLSRPEELFVLQVDNWFDHKWLRFSGIGIVDYQCQAYMNRYDAAKGEFYQNKVTFPPFAPNRIVSQRRFVRGGDGYVEAPLRAPLHKAERQRSELNLQRRIGDAVSSACFVWYSSNTLANDRASIMVYTALGGEVWTWFAGFIRENGWKLQETKRVSRDDILALIPASV